MQTLLYNQEFLRALDKDRNKTIYARITALTFQEYPIETIEGRATQGSINLDGASAVRRTCSVTIIAQDFNYNDYYWGLNTKFKLEIGVANNIDPLYPDIIWFPQGIYLITGFNTLRSTNNFTISISGKDKMCLLNGEVSGSVESPVDFGTIEEEDQNGVWTIRKLPIKEIIRNAVHSYGGELMHNIIINDLPDNGFELLEYRYDLPMYLYRKAEDSVKVYRNALINGDKLCRVNDPKNGVVKALKDLTNNELEMLVDSMIGVTEPTKIYFDEEETAYYVAKVEYGQTAGYRKTDLVYAGELVANAGDSLTSILDKIKNMLGCFEYFYDVYGRFIFQQQKTYIDTEWSAITNMNGESAVLENLMTSAATAYTFSGGELITAFNNTPNLLNMRNDYSIWGERTGISGSALAVHLRYAIDKKPESYTSIEVDDNEVADYNKEHGTTLKGQAGGKITTATATDWREVIYQMALDYFKYGWMDDFEYRVGLWNPQYPTGRTGYEQYYTDMQGFWRQLYYPDIKTDITKANSDLEVSNKRIQELITLANTCEISITDAKNALAKNPTQENYNVWRDYQTALRQYKSEMALEEKNNIELLNKVKSLTNLSQNFRDDGWCLDVFNRPDQLNFWIDFLDSEGELSQFSVPMVGERSKVINDTNVKAIYFRETPEVLFTEDLDNETDGGTSRYIQVPAGEVDKMFSISGQGKSAKVMLDDLLYKHGYCTESATINAIPIYYLEPNTRIYLHDNDTGLDGDYIISKITLPLAYNGIMDITATKAPMRIF